MALLYLVRHGEVASEGPPRYRGWSDVPLSDRGERQARQTCDRLARERFDTVFSSDLRRSLDFARVVAGPHRLAPAVRPDLREMNFGRFEGLTFDEILAVDPAAARHWTDGDPDRRFPDGEGLGDLARRVERFLEEVAAAAEGRRVLVVGHGGPLRLIVCRLLGLPVSAWWRIRLDFASLSLAETGLSGGSLCFLNDVGHLAARDGTGRSG